MSARQSAAGNLILGGVFLFLLTTAAYLTDPARPVLTIVLGWSSAILSFVCGVLVDRRVGWHLRAAVGGITLVTAAQAGRVMAVWLNVSRGDSTNAFSAFVLSLMLAISAVMLFIVLKATIERVQP